MFKEKFSELSGAVSGMKLRTKIITGVVIVLLLLTLGIGINALLRVDKDDKIVQQNIKTAEKQVEKAKVEQKKAKDELEDAKSEEAKAKEELAEAQKSGDTARIQKAQERVERATQVVQTAKNNYISASQSVTNASKAVTEAKKPVPTGNTGNGKTKKKVWIVDRPAKPAVKEQGHWDKKLVKEATTTTTYEDGMARYYFVGWTEANGYHKQKFYVHNYGAEESQAADDAAYAARDNYQDALTDRLIAIDDANWDKGIDTTYSTSVHYGQDYDYIKIPKTTTVPAEYKNVWVVDVPAKPAVPEKGHWEYR